MCKQIIEKPSVEQKAEGSLGPIVELLCSGQKGLHMIYIFTCPQEAAVLSHHPASRWETQSKSMNLKIISQHACKFQRYSSELW